MSSLLERIQSVASTTSTVGSNLDTNRVKVDKLVSVKRLLKKLQFLFDLPSRLQRYVLFFQFNVVVLSWKPLIKLWTITLLPLWY